MMNIVYNLEKEYDEGYPCKSLKTKMSNRVVGKSPETNAMFIKISNTKTKFEKPPKQT